MLPGLYPRLSAAVQLIRSGKLSKSLLPSPRPSGKKKSSPVSNASIATPGKKPSLFVFRESTAELKSRNAPVIFLFVKL